jgi:hypothetical protein
MSGLNYGYTYTKKAGMYKNKISGVSYGEKCKKWIVRVEKKGVISTVAGFDAKEEADEYYKNYLSEKQN